ncbi:hypothetical protein VIGAN_11152700 [Vigna angularis var. angularis]|uniref:Uncharacterized protein n=1 Tax=Vigna angularis var. angularis TaxID=157739 RepID=A0A0S3TAR3_PHAAN|nr:hypothetical protein VIGAN_11152700 [Vigna angularis var. angularis]
MREGAACPARSVDTEAHEHGEAGWSSSKQGQHAVAHEHAGPHLAFEEATVQLGTRALIEFSGSTREPVTLGVIHPYFKRLRTLEGRAALGWRDRLSL